MLISKICESADVQNLVNQNDSLIKTIIRENIFNIVQNDIKIVSENLDCFMRDNIVEIYENIKSFVTNDICTFLKTVSLVSLEKDISNEEKIKLFN